MWVQRGDENHKVRFGWYAFTYQEFIGPSFENSGIIGEFHKRNKRRVRYQVEVLGLKKSVWIKWSQAINCQKLKKTSLINLRFFQKFNWLDVADQKDYRTKWT